MSLPRTVREVGFFLPRVPTFGKMSSKGRWDSSYGGLIFQASLIMSRLLETLSSSSLLLPYHGSPRLLEALWRGRCLRVGPALLIYALASLGFTVINI